MRPFFYRLVLLGLLGTAAVVSAQDKAAPPAAPATTAPAGPAGIQSANVFTLPPEASTQPGYAQQSNGQRAQVQPGNNAPMWRQVGAGVAGYSSLPVREAPEAAVLVQPFTQYPGSRLTNAGEAWRQVRNQWLIPYGGALLLIVVLALALFYWRKGEIKLHGAPSGRVIERFTPFERAAHWANAIAFCSLAVSGLVIAFGKFLLLPVIGGALFGWITYALKNLHNFMGPLFAVSLVIVLLTFVRDNLPAKEDVAWLLRGGGLFGDKEIPSHRFNAGEKVVFWGGVFLLGLVVVGSGLALDKLLPGLDYLRATMQVSHLVHASAALLMMALFLGHIYMGSIGMEGAYKAMRTGYVDETWAKEHHQFWYDDIRAGHIPAQRTPPALVQTPGVQA